MRRSSLWVLLMWSTIVVATGYAQESVRRFKSNARPIVSQLLATDRHVEIEINDDPPLMTTRPGTSSRTLVESIVDACEVIVVGRVQDAKPQLVARRYLETPTASEATANWILSSVRLRVARVIKDSTHKLASGDVLEFEQSGGTARISDVTVDAVVPWRMPMVAGRNYLYCQVSDGAGKLLPGITYEIAGNGLLREMKQPELGRPSQIPDAPGELELSDAENTIGLLETESRKPSR